MVRIAHCRFLKRSPVYHVVEEDSGYYDRIVTSAWSFDENTCVLNYGATIYRKVDKQDHWCKQEHRLKAESRYLNDPVRVKLMGDCSDLSDIAIDWFIAQKLVYRFGVETKNKEDKENLDGNTSARQIKLDGTARLYSDFNELYDSRYFPTDECDDETGDECENCPSTQRSYDDLLGMLALVGSALAGGIATAVFLTPQCV